MNIRTLTLLATALAPLSLSASNISVDFGKPTIFTPPFTSATYTFAPGFDIVATGYTGDVTSAMAQTKTALFAKNNGGDEQGLGLANDKSKQNEITLGNFIQLDLSRLQAFGAQTFLLQIGSSTGNEGYQFYLSSKAGVAGTLAGTGTQELMNNSFSVATLTSTPFLSVTYSKTAAAGGNVIVGPGTIVTATPEPGTVMTLGAGLMLLGWRVRKVRAARS